MTYVLVIFLSSLILHVYDLIWIKSFRLSFYLTEVMNPLYYYRGITVLYTDIVILLVVLY
jgi:hypothetical protein